MQDKLREWLADNSVVSDSNDSIYPFYAYSD